MNFLAFKNFPRLIFATSIFVVCSCADENLFTDNTSEKTKKGEEYTVLMSQGKNTRLDMVAKNSWSDLQMNWSTNDKLAVYTTTCCVVNNVAASYDCVRNGIFSVDVNSENGSFTPSTNAMFKGSVTGTPVAGSYMYAIYPWNERYTETIANVDGKCNFTFGELDFKNQTQQVATLSDISMSDVSNLCVLGGSGIVNQENIDTKTLPNVKMDMLVPMFRIQVKVPAEKRADGKFSHPTRAQFSGQDACFFSKGRIECENHFLRVEGAGEKTSYFELTLGNGDTGEYSTSGLNNPIVYEVPFSSLSNNQKKAEDGKYDYVITKEEDGYYMHLDLYIAMPPVAVDRHITAPDGMTVSYEELRRRLSVIVFTRVDDGVSTTSDDVIPTNFDEFVYSMKMVGEGAKEYVAGKCFSFNYTEQPDDKSILLNGDWQGEMIDTNRGRAYWGQGYAGENLNSVDFYGLRDYMKMNFEACKPQGINLKLFYNKNGNYERIDVNDNDLQETTKAMFVNEVQEHLVSDMSQHYNGNNYYVAEGIENLVFFAYTNGKYEVYTGETTYDAASKNYYGTVNGSRQQLYFHLIESPDKSELNKSNSDFCIKDNGTYSYKKCKYVMPIDDMLSINFSLFVTNSQQTNYDGKKGVICNGIIDRGTEVTYDYVKNPGDLWYESNGNTGNANTGNWAGNLYTESVGKSFYSTLGNYSLAYDAYAKNDGTSMFFRNGKNLSYKDVDFKNLCIVKSNFNYVTYNTPKARYGNFKVYLGESFDLFKGNRNLGDVESQRRFSKVYGIYHYEGGATFPLGRLAYNMVPANFEDYNIIYVDATHLRLSALDPKTKVDSSNKVNYTCRATNWLFKKQ